MSRLIRGTREPIAEEDDRSAVERYATNIAYCGDGPLEVARMLPARFKIALCADPHPTYARWLAPKVVSSLQEMGHDVLTWVGRVSDPWDAGNPAPRAYLARHAAWRLEIPVWSGQAESAEELSDSLAEGARIVVGNANAWTDDQRRTASGQISQGVLAHVQETYTNVAGPWPDAYGTQGVRVASSCIGLYDGARDNPAGRRIVAAEYREHFPPGAWEHVSLYVPTAGDLTAADVEALRIE